jgi:hypothetical protein
LATNLLFVVRLHEGTKYKLEILNCLPISCEISCWLKEYLKSIDKGVANGISCQFFAMEKCNCKWLKEYEKPL